MSALWEGDGLVTCTKPQETADADDAEGFGSVGNISITGVTDIAVSEGWSLKYRRFRSDQLAENTKVIQTKRFRVGYYTP